MPLADILSSLRALLRYGLLKTVQPIGCPTTQTPSGKSVGWPPGESTDAYSDWIQDRLGSECGRQSVAFPVGPVWHRPLVRVPAKRAQFSSVETNPRARCVGAFLAFPKPQFHEHFNYNYLMRHYCTPHADSMSCLPCRTLQDRVLIRRVELVLHSVVKNCSVGAFEIYLVHVFASELSR